MFEATLSIDLGASYTKVAYRAACNPSTPGPLREDATVLMVDGSPLIPSIAIQTQRKDMPWVFGTMAAQLNPDASMTVHRNWKSRLFLPHNNVESVEAAFVAEQFFRWLRGKLEAAGMNLERTEIRVAMPAFHSVGDTARIIALCMRMSGWKSPLILKAIEPHANAVGLFSRGRSIVSRTNDGELLLDNGKMFGANNVLNQGARNFTLLGTGSNVVKVMVLDIGAFTTDFACLNFDVTSPGDGFRAIAQESHQLGVIDDLDEPLFNALGTHHGFTWDSVSFEESERFKRVLYKGERRSLNIAGSRSIELGANSDGKLIQDAVKHFGEAVWSKAAAFIEKEKPDRVYLTGGGALIPPLAEALSGRVKEKSLRLANVQEAGAAEADATKVWRPWEAAGEGLHRMATALGGTSVILQVLSEDVHSGEQTVRQEEPYRLEPGEPEPCSCRGGNKDCCFCGGTGSRRT